MNTSRKKIHKPEDKTPVRNQNQNQDHSPPQEGSPENDKGSGFGKQKQVPTVSSNLIVSSSDDISAKTKSVIELKKLQLLQLQRRLRRDFLHDFFKPITPDVDNLRTMKKNKSRRRMKQLERLELKMKEC